MAIWFDNSASNILELGSKHNHVSDIISLHENVIGKIKKDTTNTKLFSNERYLLAIDGEIENLSVLSKHIDVKDIPQLITTLYQTHGPKGLYQLQGTASVILYDSHYDYTVMYRCFMKGNSLYFVHKNNHLTISSVPLTLFYREDTLKSLDELQVASLLSISLEQSKDTVFREVSEVEHGELIVIDDSNELLRYKRSYSEIFSKRYDYSSEDQTIKTFKKYLQKEVEKQLHNEKKFGIMLSSGMDSSMVAYYAAKYLKSEGKELIAYSWELPGDSADESKMVKLLCKTLDIPLKIFDATFMGPFDQLDDIFVIPDMPNISPFWQLHQRVYQKAKDDGVNVMLGGGYGDMIYRSDRKHLLKNILKYKRFDIIRSLGLKGVLRELKRSLKHEPLPYALEPACLNVNVKNKLKKFKSRTQKGFKNYSLALSPIFLGLSRSNYLSGQYGIINADPYINEDLLHFSLNIPLHMTYRNKQTKYFAREAMKGLLPEEIRTQPRVGLIYTLMEKSFFRNKEKVREKVWEDILLWKPYIKESWMSEKFENDDNISGYDLYVIWNCLVLCTWIKAVKSEMTL